MSRKKNWAARRPRRGGQSNISVGAGPYVSVFCRGRSLDPHNKYRIGSLEPDERVDVIDWIEDPLGYAEHERRSYFRTMPRITQWLLGDVWVDRDQLRDKRDDPLLRQRWRFHCAVCGYSFIVADPRGRAAAISRLAALRADDGILEIPVRAFAHHLGLQRDDSR